MTPAEKAAEEILKQFSIVGYQVKNSITRIIDEAIDESNKALLLDLYKVEYETEIVELQAKLTAQQQVIDDCIEAGNIKNTEGMSFEDKGLMITNALEGYAAKQPLDEFVKTIDEQQQVIEQLVEAVNSMKPTEYCMAYTTSKCPCPRCSALASAKALEGK